VYELEICDTSQSTLTAMPEKDEDSNIQEGRTGNGGIGPAKMGYLCARKVYNVPACVKILKKVRLKNVVW
jgi:hypothetical protein